MKLLLIIIATVYSGLTLIPITNALDIPQECRAELNVNKNRNFESADYIDGTSFTLVLKNTSTQATTYTILTNNLLQRCSNGINKNISNNSNRSASSNVNLNVSIQTHNLNNSNISKKSPYPEIMIAGGQEYRFKVNISVPEETPFNTWSCIEVKAISNNCNSNAVKTVLSVFVTDPSEN